MPTSVYLCRQVGSVAYVGITGDLARRHRDHRRHSWWWTPETDLEVLREFEDRADARVEESRLIAEFRPPFNVHHNDKDRCLRRPALWTPPALEPLELPEVERPCTDCGWREQVGRQLCRPCRKRYYKYRWELPPALPGERRRQSWAEIVQEVRRGLDDDECWPWTKALTSQGYGVGGTQQGQKLAHRAMFVYFTDQDITGLELDHVCHNDDLTCTDGPTCLHRRCVNPRHLEVVTGEMNLARRRAESMAAGVAKRVERKTHCSNEHELTEDNIYWFRNKRLCRTCRANSRRRTEDKKKARAA